ncbi:MAG: hypothetical protein V1907_04495 [Candidatus Kerfeldbacteria bacterium]
MAPAKRSKSAPAQRSKAVPVRIIATPRPPLRARTPSSEPMKSGTSPSRQQTVPTKERNKRRIMWAGVTIVSVFIFILWIGYAQQVLTSQQGGEQTFFSKIFEDVAGVFKKFPGFSPPVNARDKELNDLRNRVFPEIDVNSNRNIDIVPSVDTNLQTNENANTNTNQDTNVTTNTPVNSNTASQ